MHLLLLLLLTSVHGASIGSIKKARITSAAPSIWLYNQSSWSQCMCYALQHPPVVAFNSYASDSSCQLFGNLISIPFQVISYFNTTVYLLQPLPPYTPCCANLTWVLSKMKSVNKTLGVTSIMGISLDLDRNRLAAVNPTTLRLVSASSVTVLNFSTSLPSSSQPITYHQNLFYVGVFPPESNTQFYIYSALDLTFVENMNFTEGSPQRITWLYNETLVCILIQSTGKNSTVNFYNWPSKTLNKSLTVGIPRTYGLSKAPNDNTFVYITDGTPNGNVWRLKTSPPYNFTVFIATQGNNEIPMALTFDSCNRLWVVFIRYGVRIYNLSSAVLLDAWELPTTTSSQFFDLALTNQYELYLADKGSNKLVRYGSPLQCTT